MYPVLSWAPVDKDKRRNERSKCQVKTKPAATQLTQIYTSENRYFCCCCCCYHEMVGADGGGGNVGDGGGIML